MTIADPCDTEALNLADGHRVTIGARLQAGRFAGLLRIGPAGATAVATPAELRAIAGELLRTADRLDHFTRLATEPPQPRLPLELPPCPTFRP